MSSKEGFHASNSAEDENQEQEQEQAEVQDQPQATTWEDLAEDTATPATSWDDLKDVEYHPTAAESAQFFIENHPDLVEQSTPEEDDDEDNSAEQHERGEILHKTLSIDYGGMLSMEVTVDQDGLVSYEYHLAAGDRPGEEKLCNNIIYNMKRVTTVEQSPTDEDVSNINLNEALLVTVNRRTGETEVKCQLTTFELRLLSQGSAVGIPFSREKLGDFKPKTDLHTHMAGAISAESLVKVGLEHDIHYPAKMLEQIGITPDVGIIDEEGKVPLSQLSEEQLRLLERGLKISQLTPETFTKMEDLYDIRGPFTKNPELFGDYLWELARDYEAQGTKYVELSYTAYLSNREYMRAMEEELPKIEEQTGVKIRFIAGLWRHSDNEWNLDEADRLEQIAHSPYIVGCDFMGQETNETKSFEDSLREMARYSMESDPLFSIRIHAGENPIFPDNVKQALQIVHDEWKAACDKAGKKLPMPRVRIGHGLYGVDDETIQLAKEMGAIVEFNMSSNLAINNIDGIKDVPIKKYIDAGVDVVLGSDGHGLYSTSAEQESILATIAGLEAEDFQKIAATEAKILALAAEREAQHTEHDEDTLYDVQYSGPDGAQHYSSAVEERNAQKRAEADRAIASRMAELGIVTDKAEIERVTEGKTPILITGASEANWPKISPEYQKQIAVAMRALTMVLNPETAYIVTGGTNFGAEKTMHEAVHKQNESSDEQLVLLGTLTMAAAKDNAAGVEADTITHAQILDFKGRPAEKWLDLADSQLDYAQERGGYMVALGGGSVVSNMIQRGHNIGAKMFLFDGPYGASTNKLKTMKGNQYQFASPAGLIARLWNADRSLFKPDFDIMDVYKIVEQAEAEME